MCVSVCASQKFAVHWESHHGKAHGETIRRDIGGCGQTNPKIRITPRIKMVPKMMTIQIKEEPKNEDD